MAKTDKQRLLVYKAVNRLRDRDIKRHSRNIAKALDKSLIPFFNRLEALGQYNDAMLILIKEDQLKEAIKEIYLTTARSFAKASEKALLKQTKKEFTDFTWANLIDRLLADNSEGGMGMLITEMNTYTKKLIAADVKAAIDNGTSISELADVLRTKYSKDVNRMRGLRIGRTETIKASNYGSLQGAYSTGIPFVKEWNSIGDSRTRESHRGIDGTKVLEDEPFNVGGSRLMYPADSSLGAAAKEVVNCRCVIDFIPADEVDASELGTPTAAPQTAIEDNPFEPIDFEGNTVNSNIAGDIRARGLEMDLKELKDTGQISYMQPVAKSKRKLILDKYNIDTDVSNDYLLKQKSNIKIANTFEQAKKNELEWVNKLTELDKADLYEYTTSTYTDINGVLRGRTGEYFDEIRNDKNLLKLIDNISNNLTKAPKFNTKSYRAIRFYKENDFNNFLNNLKQDAIFKDNAFLSTGLNREDIERFADAPFRVIMEINGKNGVLMQELNVEPEDIEILFNKGTSFNIDKIEFKQYSTEAKITITEL